MIKEHNDFLAWCNTLVSKVQFPKCYYTSDKYLVFANNQLGLSIIYEKPELNVVLPDNKHNAGPQIL